MRKKRHKHDVETRSIASLQIRDMISKHLKTIFIIFIIPIILISKPLVFSMEFYLIEDDTTSPVMTYDMSVEKIEGINDTALLMFTEPTAYVKRHSDHYSKEFRKARDLYETFPNSASLQHHFYYETGDILFSNRRFYSLRQHKSWYTGGAHPNSLSTHWIVKKSNGKTLNFRDIFKDGSDDKLKTLLDKHLLKQFNIKSLTDVLFSEEYPVSRDIYLVKKGIVFQYDPYEIAPYSTGPIEIFLPYRKIHKFLKDF